MKNRSLQISPDCSGILFMQRSEIKRFSGKRVLKYPQVKVFRFKKNQNNCNNLKLKTTKYGNLY